MPDNYKSKCVVRSWLRLEGVSFTILPFEDRDSVLRDYVGLLASVKRGVLLSRRVEYEYKHSDYSFSTSNTAFYFRAPVGSQVVFFNARPRLVETHSKNKRPLRDY